MADKIHLYTIHVAAFSDNPTGSVLWVNSGLASARSIEEATGIADRESLKTFPRIKGYYNHTSGANLASEKIINNAGYLYMAIEN